MVLMYAFKICFYFIQKTVISYHIFKMFMLYIVTGVIMYNHGVIFFFTHLPHLIDSNNAEETIVSLFSCWA